MIAGLFYAGVSPVIIESMGYHNLKYYYDMQKELLKAKAKAMGK